MTLKFGKLKWKNFLSTGAHFNEIDLCKNNRTLIIGTNGSGKSTLLDALTFTLYGKPFRKINKPQLVNSVNQKDCLTIIEFVTQGKQYKIVRGIKPTIFEIYEDGEILNQDSKSKDYQKYLENNILKMNYKAFTQIVVVGSSTYIPFMKLTPAERRAFIEDILDISIFSKMNVILKENVSETKTTASDNTTSIEMLGVKIAEKERYVAEISRDTGRLVDEKKIVMARVIEENLIISDKIEKLKEEYNTLMGESVDDVQALTKKLTELEKIEYQLTSKRNVFSREIEFYETNSACPTCTQEISDDFKTNKIEVKKQKLGEVETIKAELDTRQQTVADRLTNLKNLNVKLAALSGLISENESNKRDNDKWIKTLEEDISKIENSSGTTAGDYTKELVDLKEKLVLSNETKDKLIEEQYLYGIVAQLLRDDGIKTKIIRKYMRSINSNINKYLQSMDFFVNFELDENFNETLKSRHRDEFSYFSFSEGEKLRIDLALLFTWRELAKMKNMASTNIIVFDEVFDSSLDANGTDEFIKILFGIEANTNAFVISHKTEQLSDKFPEIIEFKKVNNFSEMF